MYSLFCRCEVAAECRGSGSVLRNLEAEEEEEVVATSRVPSCGRLDRLEGGWELRDLATAVRSPRPWTRAVGLAAVRRADEP